jgi:hypothetical protein
MTWFIEGGPWMYSILATDVLLLGALVLVFLLAIASRFVRGLRWPARVLGALLLAGSLLPALEGIVGWQLGLQQVALALAHATDDMKDMLRTQGEALASIPLYFGIMSTLPLGLASLLTAVIAAAPHGEGSNAV